MKGKFSKEEIALKMRVNLQKRIEKAEERAEAIREERNADSWCSFFYEFTLILWDGAQFFGLKTAKLDRIRGHSVGFLTKCMDFEFIISGLIFAIVSLYVLITEFSRYGK